LCNPIRQKQLRARPRQGQAARAPGAWIGREGLRDSRNSPKDATHDWIGGLVRGGEHLGVGSQQVCSSGAAARQCARVRMADRRCKVVTEKPAK
jgi:hypothetical protein